MSKKTAIDFISTGEPWAILEASLDQILAIAQRLNEEPEALVAKLGRPLENTRTVSVYDGVAVVPVQGPIFPKANLMTEISGATSLEMFVQDMIAADENPAVLATVVDFHTPGGQTVGVHEAQTLMKNLKKPCVAYIGGNAASAGYLLASAADHRVIDPMGMAGSIGVVIKPKKNDDGSMEIVSSQSPDKRPDHTTEPGRAVYQEMVDNIASVFVETVAENLGVTPEHIMSAKGRMLVGQKAVDHGLADETGTLQTAINHARQLAGSRNPHPHGYTHMSNDPNTRLQPGERINMTAAQLLAEHPTLHAELLATGEKTGFDKGYAQGKTDELARIQAIEAVAMPGHEALVATLKADGKTTAPEAAVAIIKAQQQAAALAGQQGLDALAAWQQGAPPPVKTPPLDGKDATGANDQDKPEASLPDPEDVYAARKKAA
jgi:ClpP class serine protease